ncbi:MAG: hypothetical protein IKA61_00035 [Clostridia bacterium]|nr:hypothetical protein [Clostridia bacterium]
MKLIKTVIALLTILILSCNFLSCGSSKAEQEVFKGTMSVAFASAQDAAEAYFNEQIKGGEYENCKFSGYTAKKELAKGDIDDLELGVYSPDDVISAERGKVSITYGSEVFLNTVYIIQTQDGYHYYTLEPKDEEAVCSDYYEHLVSPEILDNVTIRTSAIILIEEEGFSRQTEVSIEFCNDGEEIKFDVVIKSFFNGGVSEISLGGYILANGEEIRAYGLNEKSEYVDITREFLALFSPEQKNVFLVNQISNIYVAGHSLFKVDGDTFVVRNVEQVNLAKEFEGLYYGENGGTVNSFAYALSVTNHKIGSISSNIHSIDSLGLKNLYVSIETTFSQYGETEVDIPEEVKALDELR